MTRATTPTASTDMTRATTPTTSTDMTRTTTPTTSTDMTRTTTHRHQRCLCAFLLVTCVFFNVTLCYEDQVPEMTQTVDLVPYMTQVVDQIPEMTQAVDLVPNMTQALDQVPQMTQAVDLVPNMAQRENHAPGAIYSERITSLRRQRSVCHNYTQDDFNKLVNETPIILVGFASEDPIRCIVTIEMNEELKGNLSNIKVEVGGNQCQDPTSITTFNLKKNNRYFFFLEDDLQSGLAFKEVLECVPKELGPMLLQHRKTNHEEVPRKPTVKVPDAWQVNRIVDGEFRYDVVEGRSVNLTCTYLETGSPTETKRLKWTRHGDKINTTRIRKIDRNSQSNPIRCTLQILETDPRNDSGEYKCLVRSGRNWSEPTTLVIDVIRKNSAHVQLRIDHPNITMTESSITWSVFYRAYPEPVFVWYKEVLELLDTSKKEGNKRYGHETNHQNGTLKLTIHNPDLTDIGQYTLVASVINNKTTAASDNITMYFTTPVEPSDVKLNSSNKDLMLKKDAKFLITCTARGFPKPSVALQFKQCFSKDNCTHFSPLSKDGSGPDSGLPVGTANTAGHMVTVSVQWSRLAQLSGYYRCIAANSLNNATSPVLSIMVTDGDNVNSKVSLEAEVNRKKERGKNIQVLEGDTLVFRCLGNKVLTAGTFQWKLNNQSLSDQVKREWKLNVKRADSELSYISEISVDNVTLIVNNSSLACLEGHEHSITRVIHIEPMMAPEWKSGVDSRLRDLDLKERGNLTLKCSAEGVPSPQVTWYKDHVKMASKYNHISINENQISFEYLKTTDSGRYMCEVTNRAGTISSEAHLTVTDPDAFVDTTILTIVGVLILCLLLISIFFCRKIYQDTKRTLDLRLREQKLFNEGDPESLNPEIGIDQQAELLPYNTKYEVPRDSIIFDKLLGAGAFGRVYRATALNLTPGQARTTVAVKMMKSRTDSAQLKALRSEVKIMIHIGRHINIVNLLGACSKDLASKGELLLLVEYCKYGNILDYMRRHRKEFVNQINEDKIDPTLTNLRLRQRSGSGSRSRTSLGLKYAHLSIIQDNVLYSTGYTSEPDHSGQALLGVLASPPNTHAINTEPMGKFRCRTKYSPYNHHVNSDMSTLTFESSSGASDGYVGTHSLGSHSAVFCSKDLLCWAFQVARGMEYLAFKKVLHGDLAARNVLLAEGNIVKISDFGLSKDIYKIENYKKKSDGPLPVKWLALECLKDGVFSIQSDVWAFGVVMWEIFSLGRNPYPGVDLDENFIEKLENGFRLDKPRYSTHGLYGIMLDCWKGDPLERPSFSNLEQSLGEILGETEKQYYLELNKPYQMDNTESSFLSMLQSPDYSSKVRDISPNLDEEGYEMPFSPSPFQNVLRECETHNEQRVHTPRLTPLQIDLLQQEPEKPSGSLIKPCLSMSSLNRNNDNVFIFDQETIVAVTKRDEALANNEEEYDDDSYLKMGPGLTPNRSIGSESRDNSPVIIKIGEVPKLQRDPSHEANGSCVALLHKLVRRTSDVEKHDRGVYSPTSCMQTNPSYMNIRSFPKTEENIYSIK